MSSVGWFIWSSEQSLKNLYGKGDDSRLLDLTKMNRSKTTVQKSKGLKKNPMPLQYGKAIR